MCACVFLCGFCCSYNDEYNVPNEKSSFSEDVALEQQLSVDSVRRHYIRLYVPRKVKYFWNFLYVLDKCIRPLFFILIISNLISLIFKVNNPRIAAYLLSAIICSNNWNSFSSAKFSLMTLDTLVLSSTRLTSSSVRSVVTWMDSSWTIVNSNHWKKGLFLSQLRTLVTLNFYRFFILG